MTEKDIKKEIEEIVNRETKAWDQQDINLLMTIFHPDMVFHFNSTFRALCRSFYTIWCCFPFMDACVTAPFQFCFSVGIFS